METNSNKKAVIVGVFILVALVIFIAGILTLGGQKKTFEKKVPIIAVFKDVGGLQVGNNVWYLGVKVGTIKKMTFIKNSQVEVVMNIEIKDQQFIKKDAKAKVGSEGFIGNKLVVIYGGSPASASVVKDDVLAVENGLNTDEILSTFQQNNKNLVDVTNDFKLISKRLADGKGTIGKLMTDETLVNNLQAAVTSLKSASGYVSNYTSRLQSKGSLTNELITDTVIFSRLKSTAVQLQHAAVTANEVTDNMKLVSNNIKDVSNNIKDVSKNLNTGNSPIGVLLNDPVAANNLKSTLSNLNAGTKKLYDNMEAIQHNFLLRGFFKKKAKKEEAEKKDSLQ